MLEDKRIELEFKASVRKAKRSIKKLIKQELKILKFCLYHMNRIGVPKNREQNEMLKLLLDSYNKVIVDLNENVKTYEHYIWKVDDDS